MGKEVEMSEKNTEVWEGLDQYGKACGSEGETGERLNEKDTEGHPKEVDEKVEEKKWPCGVCEESVMEDGLECVTCKKWYHFDECSDDIFPYEYRNKPYTCSKCLERSGDKTRKPKDDTKGRKRAGRQRRHSVPDYLTGEDWTANKDKIAKSMGTKTKSKRNIEEVGSPEKTEKKLEDKKRKKQGEGTKKKDGKKVEKEEATQSSSWKWLLYLGTLLGSGGKGSEQEEEKDERQKEKAKEKEEKKEGVEGGKIETQKERTPAEKEKEIEKEIEIEEKEKEIEKQKTKTLEKKGKRGIVT